MYVEYKEMHAFNILFKLARVLEYIPLYTVIYSSLHIDNSNLLNYSHVYISYITCFHLIHIYLMPSHCIDYYYCVCPNQGGQIHICIFICI